MNWKNCQRYLSLQAWILTLLLWVAVGVRAQNTETSPHGYSQAIEDNSYFIEEAYNQEDRVVQHISNGLFTFGPTRELLFSFTQEWPVGGRAHQLSYTVPYSLPNSERSGELGDILLNYRLQVLDDDAGSAVAPRLSIILPTGSVSSGMGSGVPGIQINLPASKRLSEGFVAHANAGVTLLPQAHQVIDDGTEAKHTLTSYSVGASLIWLADPNFNLMFEALANFTSEMDGAGSATTSRQVILNPGFRCAINLGTLQMVPGIGVPFTIDSGVTRTGVFLYLSFEHPY
jgi:hypothetical protein